MPSNDSLDPLQAIELIHDRLTDEDHKRLDDDVRELLDWVPFTPPPAAVLHFICDTAKADGLLGFDIHKVKELIRKYPQLGEMVQSAWFEGKGYKEIRCLSEYYNPKGRRLAHRAAELLRIYNYSIDDPLYRASVPG